MENDDFW
ncbi:Protein of unknown function [Bacillus cereus]|nr:Protein of unknown function [Bacillus cereus]